MGDIPIYTVLQGLRDGDTYEDSVDAIVKLIEDNFLEAPNNVFDSVDDKKMVFKHSAIPFFFENGKLCIFVFRSEDGLCYKALDAEDSQKAWEIVSGAADGEYVLLNCTSDEDIPYNLMMSRGEFPYAAETSLYKGGLKYLDMGFGELETLKHAVLKMVEYENRINEKAVPIILNGKPIGATFGGLLALDDSGTLDLSYLNRDGSNGLKVDVVNGSKPDTYIFRLLKSGFILDCSDEITMPKQLVPSYARTIVDSFIVLEKLQDLKDNEVLYQTASFDRNLSTVWNGLSWDADGKPVVREISTANTIDPDLAASVFGVAVSTSFGFLSPDIEPGDDENFVDTGISWTECDNITDFSGITEDMHFDKDEEIEEVFEEDEFHDTFESTSEIPDILMKQLSSVREALERIKEKYDNVHIGGIPEHEKRVLKRLKEINRELNGRER